MEQKTALPLVRILKKGVKTMKAYYHGFIIEQDETTTTELYYLRREDNSSFTAADGRSATIDSMTGTLPQVISYIESITA